MYGDPIFTAIFIGQLLLASVVLPLVVHRSTHRAAARHPEAEYPRLYPKPWAWYARRLRHVAIGHGLALLVGLFFLLNYLMDATNDDYAGIVWIVGMVQSVPWVMIEVLAFRQMKLLSATDDRRHRSASLTPRGPWAFVRPVQVAAIAGAFAVFCAYVAWMQQFDHPWFGGWLNVAILGGTIVVMGAGLAWSVHRVMRLPFLHEADRLHQARRQVAQYTLIMVALMAYAMVTIWLRTNEQHGLRQVAMSLYFQALFLGYYLTMLRSRSPDLEVFRREAVSGA